MGIFAFKGLLGRTVRDGLSNIGTDCVTLQSTSRSNSTLNPKIHNPINAFVVETDLASYHWGPLGNSAVAWPGPS